MRISSESKKSSTTLIINHKREMRTHHLCRHKSALSYSLVIVLLLLLHMIDCSQCVVNGGQGPSTPDKSTSGNSLPETKYVGTDLMTKLKLMRQQQQANSNQSLASTQAVDLMKRSTSSSTGKLRSESFDWDGILVSEPDEINELRVKTTSPHVVLGPSTSGTVTASEAATVGLVSSVSSGNESSEYPGRIEVASREFANDSTKENDCNLLDKLKSFFETVSEKIILCVNNLKGYQRKVEPGNVNNDKQAGLEGRPSGRLSKSEIMQIILDDFNLGVDAINHDNNKITSEKADEKLDMSADDDNQSNTARSVAEQGPIGSQASNNQRTIEMKSMTDKFKDRLNSMLDDDKVVILHDDTSNSITIDLDFLKLQKRESAQSHSFPPIEQLKKVMNFMHFG